jgi:hypothetical protein
MWQNNTALLEDENTALLEDIDVADWRPSLAVGDAVGVRAGTADPDFPDRQLDGWTGVLIALDKTIAPMRCLVQWDRTTLDGMSADYRVRCEMEDFALEQMWLSEDDLDAQPA